MLDTEIAASVEKSPDVGDRSCAVGLGQPGARRPLRNARADARSKARMRRWTLSKRTLREGDDCDRCCRSAPRLRPAARVHLPTLHLWDDLLSV